MEIHRLKQPDGLLINRLWSKPDMFVMDEDKFKNTFPGRVYDDELNPENWEKSRKYLHGYSTQEPTPYSTLTICRAGLPENIPLRLVPPMFLEMMWKQYAILPFIVPTTGVRQI